MDVLYGTKKFLSGSKDFLDSNTVIAKISFVLLIIIAFVILFNIGYHLLNYFLSPSKSPYLISGMKDAKTYMKIPQNMNLSGAKPIFRSRDQYNGLEYTWATWFYIDDPTYNGHLNSQNYRNIFVKGSTSTNSDGMFNNTNGPGVYLTNNPLGQIESSDYVAVSNNVTISLHIRVDIYPILDVTTGDYIYYQDIIIENIPIKKWVCLMIRCSSQNVYDIIINGSLSKRVKLLSSVRQNYDDVFVSANGGFDGFISNLRYFNYAIGTFEIDQIVSAGPDLTMDRDLNIAHSSPYYLSTKWLFSES